MTASLNGPLQIDGLVIPGGGEIGLVHCPGRHHVDDQGGEWARDLARDLAAIKAWPAALLLTLIEPKEFARLGVTGLGEQARATGLDWHHVPIPDMHPPDAAFEKAWPALSHAINQLFARGERAVLHCAGGRGRAGTVAARILIDHGVTAPDAIKAVRAARPGAIETLSQENYLTRCAAS